MSAEPPSAAELGKRLDTILPEFYYDLIARIIPGVVLVLGAVFASGTAEPAAAFATLLTLAWAPVVLLLIIISIAGYVAGILLTYFQSGVRSSYSGAVWRVVLRQYRDVIIKRQDELGLNGLRTKLDECQLDASGRSSRRDRKAANRAIREVTRPLYGELHDLLKDRHPQARFVLPKMNGETGLCENTAVSLILVMLVALVHTVTAPTGPVATRLVQAAATAFPFAVLALLFFRAAVVRYEALLRRHFAFWNLIPEPRRALEGA